MSLSEVSPFYSSAPSIFTDYQPKTGTDSVSFYIDFGSSPKRFGGFTVSKIFKNGQNYSETNFQVFTKDNSGTFEKYQQLRIGDYEFKKFCFLKNNILNGELEVSEQPTQFDKNPCMEDVLQRCHKVREVSIGRNRQIYVTFIQYSVSIAHSFSLEFSPSASSTVIDLTSFGVSI